MMLKNLFFDEFFSDFWKLHVHTLLVIFFFETFFVIPQTRKNVQNFLQLGRHPKSSMPDCLMMTFKCKSVVLPLSPVTARDFVTDGVASTEQTLIYK